MREIFRLYDGLDDAVRKHTREEAKENIQGVKKELNLLNKSILHRKNRQKR